MARHCPESKFQWLWGNDNSRLSLNNKLVVAPLNVHPVLSDHRLTRSPFGIVIATLRWPMKLKMVSIEWPFSVSSWEQPFQYRNLLIKILYHWTEWDHEEIEDVIELMNLYAKLWLINNFQKGQKLQSYNFQNMNNDFTPNICSTLNRQILQTFNCAIFMFPFRTCYI